VVALNHAIAAAMVHGPSAGLELLDALTGTSVWRVITGSTRCAVTCWASGGTGWRAHTIGPAEGTASPPERNYLLTKAARLAATGDP
jgi:hypothetical protein